MRYYNQYLVSTLEYQTKTESFIFYFKQFYCGKLIQEENLNDSKETNKTNQDKKLVLFQLNLSNMQESPVMIKDNMIIIKVEGESSMHSIFA